MKTKTLIALLSSIVVAACVPYAATQYLQVQLPDGCVPTLTGYTVACNTTPIPPIPPSGGNVVAASCAQADVQTAITAAVNGDTVTIPAGACTWSALPPISKQIKLTGAPSFGTVITASGSGDILTFTIGSQFRTEIANIKFLAGTATGNYLIIKGVGLPPYMHDMSFNVPNFQLVRAVDWMVQGGVISKSTFESTSNLNGACGTMIGSESGTIRFIQYNQPWTNASTMGMADVNGDKNVYVEDSIFSNVGQIDLDDNARVVIRHNQMIASSALTHGTTGTYGGRHIEMYDNVMTLPNLSRNFNRWFWFRAGTGVITGNSMDAMTGQCYGNKPSVQFTVENAQRGSTHGCCTGYMCFHQTGSGSDGTGGHNNLSAGQTPADPYQISEPIWIWGNTGPGAAEDRFTTGEGQPADCGTNYSTPMFFKRDRDWFMNAGPKPGWTRYTYPHPITTGGVTPIPPPTGTNVGETAILPSTGTLGSCSVDMQPVTVPGGTLQGVSFYLRADYPAGTLDLGLYNATGARVAHAEVSNLTTGWNTAAMTATLAAGTYTLAAGNKGNVVMSTAYGPGGAGAFAGGYCGLPSTKPAGQNTNPAVHWSMYLTMAGTGAKQ